MRTLPRLWVRSVLGIALAGAWPLGALAISNQEFASQVRAWRGQMLQDEQVVGDAAMLCAYLPPHRSMEEPQCVALRGHLRATRPEAQASKRTRLGLVLEYAARLL